MLFHFLSLVLSLSLSFLFLDFKLFVRQSAQLFGGREHFNIQFGSLKISFHSNIILLLQCKKNNILVMIIGILFSRDIHRQTRRSWWQFFHHRQRSGTNHAAPTRLVSTSWLSSIRSLQNLLFVTVLTSAERTLFLGCCIVSYSGCSPAPHWRKTQTTVGLRVWVAESNENLR